MHRCHSRLQIAGIYQKPTYRNYYGFLVTHRFKPSYRGPTSVFVHWQNQREYGNNDGGLRRQSCRGTTGPLRVEYHARPDRSIWESDRSFQSLFEEVREKFRVQESRIRVALHQSVDLQLSIIERVVRRIRHVLADNFSHTTVQTDLYTTHKTTSNSTTTTSWPRDNLHRLHN